MAKINASEISDTFFKVWLKKILVQSCFSFFLFIFFFTAKTLFCHYKNSSECQKKRIFKKRLFCNHCQFYIVRVEKKRLEIKHSLQDVHKFPSNIFTFPVEVSRRCQI